MPTISLVLPRKNISLVSSGFSGFRSVAYISGPTGPSGAKGLDGSGMERIHGVFPIVYDSGSQSISFDSGILDYYLTRNETGQFYPNNNPSGFITGIDTGNFYTLNNPSGFATTGDLSASSGILDQKINVLSGNNYYPSYNPSGFINNLSGLSVSFVLGASGSLKTDITNTGFSLNAKIDALSGNNYYPSYNPSGFLNTLSGLSIGYVSGVSGALQFQVNNLATASDLFSTGQQVLDAATNNSINLSGELTNTGIVLIDKIDSLSGFVLLSTGVQQSLSGFITTGESDVRYYSANNPSGFINNLSGLSFSLLTGASGALQDSVSNSGSLVWATANNNALNLSGDLTQTGIQLINLINAASGGSATVSDVVYTSGSQTISGLKVFTSGIDFDTPIAPAWHEGRVFYDSGEHTLAYYNDNSQMTVNIGQELIVRVGNKLGYQVDNGKVVYISGSWGNRPAVYLPIASDVNSHLTIGVATTDIPNNSEGYVCLRGFVRGVNTNAFTEGDLLYLSSSVSGGLTNVMPPAPNHTVLLGLCTKKAANGEIFCSPHVGTDMKQICDVGISNLSNNDILVYNSGSGFWQNTPSFSGLLEQKISSTGGSLDYKINSLSGFVSGMSGVLQNAINNNSGLTTGETNSLYYSINNPSGYITGFNSGLYATKTELINSGALLQDYFGVNNKSMYLGFDASGTTTGMFYENGVNIMLYRNASGSITGIYSNQGKLKIVLRNSNNKATGIRYT